MLSSYSSSITLDFVPLFFFFFLYSFLEILIATTMENYRFIQIEQEEEEFEDDEDYDAGEFEEHIIPQRIVFPVDLNLIEELEDDDDDSDYDDDYGDDDDYDDDDYEDDVEEYYEEEEAEELIPVETTLPRVSTFIADGGLNRTAVINGDSIDNLNDSESNAELNRTENDGIFCPICFEAWTSGGEHQICCLPCGHIYGLSCIKKWLQQRRSSGKCPQCNNLCTLKDVRVLYTSRLCVSDEELHKRVLSLEAKCAYLEHKAARLKPEELIDEICSNPVLMQQLATRLAKLHQ